jgi:hypothetical protein
MMMFSIKRSMYGIVKVLTGQETILISTRTVALDFGISYPTCFGVAAVGVSAVELVQ